MWGTLKRKTGVVLALLSSCGWAVAQAAPGASAQAGASAQVSNQQGAPPTITLQDALQRARTNLPQFQSALTDLGVAKQDKVIARAAMLPSVNYTTQALFTQANGTFSGVYIAANSVNEYISQGNVHEVINLAGGQFSDYRRAGAAQAVAEAKAEIATRGLQVTVVQAYYGYVIAQRKYATAQQGATEAQRFLNISQQLASGGEVANSDVIKARLQNNDRQVGLQEAQLAMDKARLQLAVLLFPNFEENFTVVDDLQLPAPLPAYDDVLHLAQQKNPDLRVASASLEAANHEVQVAWAEHFPTLTMDYWYGIDAARFATYSDGVRNLGFSAAATLTIPIWSWGATQAKVKQAQLQRQQARLELTFAQKQLLSNIRQFYSEAQLSRAELDSLRNSADLAADSLRLTTLRYQGGEATVLEVVDAQNTLVQTRDAFDDGAIRYSLALANLQTLTGNF